MDAAQRELDEPGAQHRRRFRLGVGDLSKFDVQAVMGVLHDAPQTLQLYDAPQTFLAVESRKDGTLYINVHVSDNTRRSGSIVVSADGAVTEIDRPRR